MNANTSRGNDTGTGAKFGLGFDYAISREFSVGGEWDHYQFNVFGGTPYVDQLAIDVKFKF